MFNTECIARSVKITQSNNNLNNKTMDLFKTYIFKFPKIYPQWLLRYRANGARRTQSEDISPIKASTRKASVSMWYYIIMWRSVLLTVCLCLTDTLSVCWSLVDTTSVYPCLTHTLSVCWCLVDTTSLCLYYRHFVCVLRSSIHNIIVSVSYRHIVCVLRSSRYNIIVSMSCRHIICVLVCLVDTISVCLCVSCGRCGHLNVCLLDMSPSDHLCSLEPFL